MLLYEVNLCFIIIKINKPCFTVLEKQKHHIRYKKNKI